MLPLPAYPDMLEVGNLANFAEDRSHFSAWAITSSPLILSYNLADPERMARVWPIISNRGLIAVNQKWDGDPGRRVAVAEEWQGWAKRLQAHTYAVLLMSTATNTTLAKLPLANVSASYQHLGTVCLRDMYTGRDLGPVPLLESLLEPHDSTFFCMWPPEDNGHDCQVSNTSGCPRLHFS